MFINCSVFFVIFRANNILIILITTKIVHSIASIASKCYLLTVLRSHRVTKTISRHFMHYYFAATSRWKLTLVYSFESRNSFFCYLECPFGGVKPKALRIICKLYVCDKTYLKGFDPISKNCFIWGALYW